MAAQRVNNASQSARRMKMRYSRRNVMDPRSCPQYGRTVANQQVDGLCPILKPHDRQVIN
jgi:hypothetical protein